MRCYQCMKEFDGDYEICPHCGYVMNSEPKVLYHLVPGVMLQNRYTVGVALGWGGFGVTYIAWDNTLDTVVAIKEHFPTALVNRVPGTKAVIVYSGNGNQEFNLTLERFLDEAKHTAKFSGHKNIVNVYNYFEENNTGYMVMELLDGISLKGFLAAEDGRIDLKYATEITLAVANALKAIHKENLLHRDVSPDNIYLLKNGDIKLIDLGAARLSAEEELTRSVILKPGYAPPEQYQKRGKQGPWTDVYALGATLYRMVTGEVPEESVDRKVRDTLKTPRHLYPEIPEHIDNAIMRAMSLEIAYRYRTVDEFVDVLTNKKKTLALEEEIKRRKRRRRLSLTAAILLLVIAGGFMGFQVLNANNSSHLKENLEMWVCVEDGEDAEALTQYYQDFSNEVFGKDYKNVTVDVKAVPEAEYKTLLLSELSKGGAPEIFECPDADGDILGQARELDDLIQNIDENGSLTDYYFFNEYSRYVPDRKRFPIGFEMPMVYTLQRGMVDAVTLDEVGSDFVDLNDAGDRKAAVEKLSNGGCSYLVGTSSDYDFLQKEIYGTYEEQKENIAGELDMAYLSDGEPEFTTAFCVNQKCSSKEEQAVYLYLQYMISYQEQYMLHSSGAKDGVKESCAFSVNKKADSDYRNKIKSAFSILEDKLGEL